MRCALEDMISVEAAACGTGRISLSLCLNCNKGNGYRPVLTWFWSLALDFTLKGSIPEVVKRRPSCACYGV